MCIYITVFSNNAQIKVYSVLQEKSNIYTPMLASF